MIARYNKIAPVSHNVTLTQTIEERNVMYFVISKLSAVNFLLLSNFSPLKYSLHITPIGRAYVGLRLTVT